MCAISRSLTSFVSVQSYASSSLLVLIRENDNFNLSSQFLIEKRKDFRKPKIQLHPFISALRNLRIISALPKLSGILNSFKILFATRNVTLIQCSRTLQEPIHTLWSRIEIKAARKPTTTATIMSALHLVFVFASSSFGRKGSA